MSEPSLVTAEERWRLTIDNAPVGIALVSLEGQFMRVNKALCSMVGYDEDTLHELTFQRITHPDDLDADLDLLHQLLAGDIESYRMRKRYLHRSGHVIWADLSVGLVRNPRGMPLHLVSHVIDRTEETLVAQQLERSNADLEGFAALASHDLQAPLTTIKGYLEALDEEYAEALDERAHAWITRVGDSVDRMSELVSSLLAWSRAAHAPDRELVSVTELVKLVLRDLDRLVGEHGAVVEVGPDLPPVMAERARLRQVLQNLVQNAIKYRHPERPPVCLVEVVERDDGWLVSVTDNAVGVPDDQREQVFTMFGRSETREPGHGIGLAACRQVVERHGGHIWVEDAPSGEGSRFCFTLPR